MMTKSSVLKPAIGVFPSDGWDVHGVLGRLDVSWVHVVDVVSDAGMSWVSSVSS